MLRAIVAKATLPTKPSPLSSHHIIHPLLRLQVDYTTLRFIIYFQPCAADDACSHQYLESWSDNQPVLFMEVYLHNETIILQKWSSTPKYYTTSCIMSQMDKQKIDNGIRFLVKMSNVKSGKKVVVWPRTRII